MPRPPRRRSRRCRAAGRRFPAFWRSPPRRRPWLGPASWQTNLYQLPATSPMQEALAARTQLQPRRCWQSRRLAGSRWRRASVCDRCVARRGQRHSGPHCCCYCSALRAGWCDGELMSCTGVQYTQAAVCLWCQQSKAKQTWLNLPAEMAAEATGSSQVHACIVAVLRHKLRTPQFAKRRRLT